MNNDDKGRKQPFEVHIIDDDDGLLDPSELDNLTPDPVQQKKKFEVHIDEDSIEDFDADDQRPRYNGEVYFSNRKPVKPHILLNIINAAQVYGGSDGLLFVDILEGVV